jgi:asparagine synthase (glutamine-hydrolysing)
MCGFVAAIGPAAQLGRPVLDSMRDRVAHRGPDGARTEIRPLSDNRVLALGHRRLSIIDLTDAAAQPMTRANGALTIVYNGEIYNYVELRAELRQYGTLFKTQSDTEVLLAAYERWGTDCLDRLNGMFAFALWDERSNELFVARDRFGEKPLFYAELPSGIAVASEIKALLAHPEVSTDVNEAVVERYAMGAWYEDGDETFFRRVVRLPPAHAMTIDASGSITRRWRYWTPDYSAVQDRYEEGAAVERFRALLERSLHLRLRSDVPIGTSLSGGLDSSTIVCRLSQLRTEATMLSQNTFSGRFEDDPTISEGPLVDVIVRAAAVNAFHTTADPLLLAEESARVHWHQEEPFLSASIYLQWCVMRLANEQETTVLLDGQGADEVLAGYQPYFRTHQLDLLDRREFARRLHSRRASGDSGRSASTPAGRGAAVQLAADASAIRGPQRDGVRTRDAFSLPRPRARRLVHRPSR